MNKIILVLLFSFLCGQAQTNEAMIFKFHILPGTQSGPWNTAAEMIDAKLGDVVRIYNDDSVDHQLHTLGAPCPHSPVIAPGKVWDCEIIGEYNSKTSGAIYDHIYGPDATFWLSSTR